MSDPDELKAKYAEIAWLKKQIEEKKASRKQNGISKSTKPLRKPYIASQRNLNSESVDSGDEKYISNVTNHGMTLVHTNIYKREQKLQKLKAEVARKLQMEAQDRARRQKWMPKIAKNRTKTDACDQISLGDFTYAVSCGGNKLVPLTIPPADSDGEIIEWNHAKYIRKKSGTLRLVRRLKE